MLTQLNHITQNRQFHVNYKPTIEPIFDLELTSKETQENHLSRT